MGPLESKREVNWVAKQDKFDHSQKERWRVRPSLSPSQYKVFHRGQLAQDGRGRRTWVGGLRSGPTYGDLVSWEGELRPPTPWHCPLKIARLVPSGFISSTTATHLCLVGEAEAIIGDNWRWENFPMKLSLTETPGLSDWLQQAHLAQETDSFNLLYFLSW